MEAPAFEETRPNGSGPQIASEASDASDPEVIHQLIVEQLRDLLHAEKQLVKALPKMAKAAKSAALNALFEQHLQETEAQVERLNAGLKLLDAPIRARTRKGMAGLLEEGEEVFSEGNKKDNAGADPS